MYDRGVFDLYLQFIRSQTTFQFSQSLSLFKQQLQAHVSQNLSAAFHYVEAP